MRLWKCTSSPAPCPMRLAPLAPSVSGSQCLARCKSGGAVGPSDTAYCAGLYICTYALHTFPFDFIPSHPISPSHAMSHYLPQPHPATPAYITPDPSLSPHQPSRPSPSLIPQHEAPKPHLVCLLPMAPIPISQSQTPPRGPRSSPTYICTYICTYKGDEMYVCKYSSLCRYRTFFLRIHGPRGPNARLSARKPRGWWACVSGPVERVWKEGCRGTTVGWLLLGRGSRV